MPKLWTKEEITCLRKKYPTTDASKIAEHLGRSADSVIIKAGRCGIKSSKFKEWAEWENRYLIRHFNEKPIESMARTLKRSVPSVYAHAKTLGLTEPGPRRWTAEEKKYLENSYPDHSISLKEISEHVKRPISVVYSYAQGKGLYRGLDYRRWTKEEHKYLVKNYRCKKYKEIAKHLGFSRTAVAFRANKYGLFKRSHPRIWTEQEIEFIRQNYSILTIEEIANQLSRTKGSIIGCADRLRLRGSHNWHKPANITTRVSKFKQWFEKQVSIYGKNFNSKNMKTLKLNINKTVKQL